MKTSRVLVLICCCVVSASMWGDQETPDTSKPKDSAPADEKPSSPRVEGPAKVDKTSDKALINDLPANRDESSATTKVNDDSAIHDELRAMRTALTEAVTKGDIEGQLAYVDKNVVATWQNNRVVRGPDGLRSFLKEMDTANGKVFRGYKVEPEADELTILYGGDAGIVFGKSVPQYHYLGMDFELENRWTATLVKDDGKWKIAAYHVSANVMDNPVLNMAKKSAYWAGGGCLVIGVILGMIGSAVMRRRST